MKRIKKYSLITLTMFIFIAFNSFGVLAADDSVFDLGTRNINDVNKTWIITFSDAVDFTSVQNNIQIKDITTDKSIIITPTQGDHNNTVKVNAPSGGYIVGHSYQVSVNKNIKLVTGAYLPQTTVMTFWVLSKNMSDYTASANVIVSPVIDAFKQITITSTTLPGAKKYKIKGNKTLVDIGKPLTSIVGEDTVEVYICDSQGNTLGKTTVDVSSTKSNMTLNLQ